MSVAIDVARAGRGDRVRSGVAIFRQMVDGLAEVNVDTATIRVPCDGFTPPIPGMPVRLTWVNGRGSVSGPAKPLPARGTITATGSPKATVSVDGQTYVLWLAAGYTPTVGDTVAIRWDFEGGCITGKVLGFDKPTAPDAGGNGPKPFTKVVKAIQSGRYQSGSGWWGPNPGRNDPWASASNVGAWFYGNTVKDAVGSGSVATVDIFLPLSAELSGGKLALHQHATMPAGAPALTGPWEPPSRDGWVRLPQSWASWLTVGGRGVGVMDGGYTIWRGLALDGFSGALRITGTA